MLAKLAKKFSREERPSQLPAVMTTRTADDNDEDDDN